MSPAFQRAVQEARTILKETGDPQRSDVALDRACFGEMAQLAKDCKSAFLEGYVRLCIDAANLRTAVRVARMEKGSDFLLQVLLPGGNVSEKTLSAAGGRIWAVCSRLVPWPRPPSWEPRRPVRREGPSPPLNGVRQTPSPGTSPTPSGSPSGRRR